jgi:lysophosphatidylglycerol acyltransferase 1
LCGLFSDDEMKSESESDCNELKWILDVTIAYPEAEPMSLSDICFATRAPFNTTVVYRLFPANRVPRDPALAADWLYSRWQEKEEILSTFYASGEIPLDKISSNPVPARILLQNPLRQIIIHLFFLLSFFSFFNFICLLVSPNILVKFLVLYLIFLTLKVTKVI